MAQDNKTCEICGEKGHSKFYCKKKPFKAIRQVSLKKSLRLGAQKTTIVRSNPDKPRLSSKKKKKTPLQLAKDKAWDAFSVYIRTRDCIRFTGDPTMGMCVTCSGEKAWRPFKELQAGHFISSRRNSILFDEDIVYSQCYGCNVGQGGSYVEYFVFMEQEWGRDKIDEFRARKHQTVQYKLHDYVEIRQKFIDKTNVLLGALSNG